MAKPKTYINQCMLKEVTFDNGGSLLNLNVNIQELEEHIGSNGWINLTIAKRREVGEKGQTHYMYLNDFKPSNGTSSNNRDSISINNEMDDDLPF
jgi:hypothetical protein